MQDKTPRPISPAVASARLKSVRCESTHRLLFKANVQGIFVFCRQHNEQHLISWHELEQLRAEMYGDTEMTNCTLVS